MSDQPVIEGEQAEEPLVDGGAELVRRAIDNFSRWLKEKNEVAATEIEENG